MRSPKISFSLRFLFVAVLAALALPGLASAATTERVQFSSAGTTVVGYLHRPEASTPRPVVIIAHGFGGLQSSRLGPIADAFADAGYNALTFDYRTWGESSGRPRNIIDIAWQQHDYRAAIAAATKMPGVDPERVVLWGTSFSGGHVLELATKGIPNVKAVIAQAPHVNGYATIAQLPAADLPSKIGAGLEDASRAALGLAPKYIPLVGDPGQLATLTQPAAKPGYAFVQPTSPRPGNVVAARIVLALPFFNPELTNRGTNVPTLMSVKTDDTIVSPGASIRMAQTIHATLDLSPGGHFDVYPGADGWPKVIADQIAFLDRTVPIAPAA